MTTDATEIPEPSTDQLMFAVPPRWRRRADPLRGVVVAARAPTMPPSGVRPELVLRCCAVDDNLVTWRAGAVDELSRRLVDFDVEDEDVFDLGGEEVVYRRFAHRVGAADVVCDQWAWLLGLAVDPVDGDESGAAHVAGGMGLTLTGMVAREDYADYCDVFEAVADTVGLMPRAA